MKTTGVTNILCKIDVFTTFFRFYSKPDAKPLVSCGICGKISLFNIQVEALLTVIALSIFADERVLSSEISAFIKSAKDIEAHVTSDVPVTEAKLLMWFEMNRLRLSDKIRLGPIGFKHWFESVIAELSAYSDEAFVVDMLNRISVADGELHVSEKALSVLVEGQFRSQAKTA